MLLACVGIQLTMKKMQDSTLLEKIKNTGLSEEEAVKALSVIADYAKEKFPILQGNINAFVKQEFRQADPVLLSRVLNN